TYVNAIGGGEQDQNLIQLYLANGPAWIQYLQANTSVKFSTGGADQYFLAPGILPNNGSDTVSPSGSGAALIAAEDALIQSKGAQLFLNTQVTQLWKDATGTILGVSAIGYKPPYAGSGHLGLTLYSAPTSTSSSTTSTTSASSSSSGVGWPSTTIGKVINVKANKGVILASGGFDWNSQMLLNFVRGPEPFAEGVLTNTGDGQMMGAAVGAQLANMNNVSGQTLYLTPSADGYQGLIAIEDSGAGGKPNALQVNRFGNRFIDECLGGHLYFRTLHEWDSTLETYINYPAFTIFDSVHRSHYAIAGVAANAAVPSWIASSSTLAGLAATLGINATQLQATVAAFNANAILGLDPQFGRGQNILDKSGGDSLRTDIVNPCLGPVSTPPFYGLQLVPGMTGTVGGVKINTKLQVVDWNDNPIPGLYAAGAASAGFWGEGFPGRGSNVGPCHVFGWLAGKSVAGVTLSSTLNY
ncbi:MAG: FAD-binding protein, partial [Nitrososphaerales archaeon]